MVKRTSYTHLYYIAFALILLICCWEAGRNNTVVYASGSAQVLQPDTDETIPEESIRLRILANSDSPTDQWVKREVRDAIVEQMSQWVQGPHTIEEARETVRGHLPELNELVGKTLNKYGFTYPYQVELGMVPFPMKMYGSQIYPAGDYEALRVSLGEAEGQNWWCVLFPPLCFVDSDAIAKKTNVAEAAAVSEPSKEQTGGSNQQVKAKAAKDSKEQETGKAASSKSSTSTGAVNAKQPAVAQTAAPEPEIHFFLWDLLKKLGSLFA